MTARRNPALRLLAWLVILADRREPGSPRAALRTPALAGAYLAAREAKRQEAGK